MIAPSQGIHLVFERRVSNLAIYAKGVDGREATEGLVVSYIHGGGRIGVLVEVGFLKPDTGKNDALKPFIKDIAMHVAAAAPAYVTREEAPADVVEHELSIYRAQAAESGKPEQIQQKMAEGRLEKFYKEVALVEQPYVKNPDISVAQYVTDTAKALGDELSVIGFERFVLGQSQTR